MRESMGKTSCSTLNTFSSFWSIFRSHCMYIDHYRDHICNLVINCHSQFEERLGEKLGCL